MKHRSCHRRGSALLVGLAVVLLVTVVIVAFFSQTQLNQRIENSGAARTKAEILARSGLDYTVSRLVAEITDPANSEEVAPGVYRPRTGASMRPVPQLKPRAETLRAVHVPGLLKQSIVAFDPAASAVNSASPDRTGRSVGPKRWNAPMFYFSQPQFTAAAQTPDWIYLPADGPGGTGASLGRIAFNVYEIDGLLDLNAAGYPEELNADVAAINALKATVAGANLRKISRFVRYLDQSLVDRRSRGSVRGGATVRHTLENTNGFLQPAPGDTHFVSRLDLVRYATTFGLKASASAQLDTNAMAFVTAWSRALDAPSWRPPTPTEVNVFAPAVRRTNEIRVIDYLLDGRSRVQEWREGDAVAARRFPLTRIGWFERTDSTNHARAIRQSFGLDPLPDGTWKYFDPLIRTLGELRGADREPNFFELLKAAIESGSLGRALGGEEAALTAERDADRDLQILRIGASIIDAAMASHVPTVIAFEPTVDRPRFAAGVKDLPGLYGVRFRQIVKTDAGGAPERVDQFALPILVNPHAPPATPEARQAPRPPVRVRLIGTVENAVADADGSVALEARFPASPAEGVPPNPRTLGFEAGDHRTPAPPPLAVPAPGASPTMPADYATSFAGFWLASGAAGGADGASRGRAELRGFNVVAEVWNGRAWIVYDALFGDGRAEPTDGWGESVTVEFSSGAAATPTDAAFTGADTECLLKPDPRTNRWGPLRGQTAAKPTEVPGEAAFVREPPADPDGQTRSDDFAIAADVGSADASPKRLLLNESPELRVALPLRPFRSVGELGVVFRDQPWKTLDFASEESADAALLDFFTINEPGPDALVAGRVNLNLGGSTLDAQLSQTALEVGRDGVLDDEGSPRIARIANAVSGGLFSPADLVGRVPADLEKTKTKHRHEAAIRALGTAGQTRTWNFFIDLIAQSGRLPPGSGDPADFFAEGESRLWMHVAIDRFTGRVLATSVEAYQE